MAVVIVRLVSSWLSWGYPQEPDIRPLFREAKCCYCVLPFFAMETTCNTKSFHAVAPSRERSPATNSSKHKAAVQFMLKSAAKMCFPKRKTPAWARRCPYRRKCCKLRRPEPKRKGPWRRSRLASARGLSYLLRSCPVCPWVEFWLAANMRALFLSCGAQSDCNVRNPISLI